MSRSSIPSVAGCLSVLLAATLSWAGNAPAVAAEALLIGSYIDRPLSWDAPLYRIVVQNPGDAPRAIRHLALVDSTGTRSVGADDPQILWNTVAAGGEVRMILIPRGYHDSAMLGANHGGGRVVINFHLENGIP